MQQRAEFEQILDRVVLRIHDQEYIDYYGSKRPHQGIDQRLPRTYNPQLHGNVLKVPISAGLFNHYLKNVASWIVFIIPTG